MNRALSHMKQHSKNSIWQIVPAPEEEEQKISDLHLKKAKFSSRQQINRHLSRSQLEKLDKIILIEVFEIKMSNFQDISSCFL
jgi:hypothetical protein